MIRAALITGISGGLGSALGQAFRSAGWRVIGVDQIAPSTDCTDTFIQMDLAAIGASGDASALRARVHAAAQTVPLGALINNAAVQHLDAGVALDWARWRETLDVNLSAPFALARAFAPELSTAQGVIINIGSVHAQATKPRFAAYATSKAALHGLTRALAVDFGPNIRVVALAPAALDTDMLRAGFASRPEKLQELANAHPAGRIGAPAEAARAALFLASPDSGFLTGSVLYLDGGVLARLHDPE